MAPRPVKALQGNKKQQTISTFFAPKQSGTKTTSKNAEQPAKESTHSEKETPIREREKLDVLKNSAPQTRFGSKIRNNGKAKSNVVNAKIRGSIVGQRRRSVENEEISEGEGGNKVVVEPHDPRGHQELEQEEHDDLPQKLPRRFANKARAVSKKRVFRDNNEDGNGGEEGEYLSGGRKRLRRGQSYKPEGGGEPEDVDMDEAPEETLSTRSVCENFRGLSGSRKPSAGETDTREKTSRFNYVPRSISEKVGVHSYADKEYQKEKEKLHEKFIAKLKGSGAFQESSRKQRGTGENSKDDVSGEEEGDGEYVAEDMEDGEDPAPKVKGRSKGAAASRSSTKKGKTKLTPLEKQVVDIKMQHPDTVLVVEVGYKFRFFGEDARIAAKELSIMCIPGKLRFDEHPSESHLDRFASASIPVHRLHVHVKRLVAAGHKVGIVRQLETAALKAIGDNRYTPFTRKLTNLYTKGTYVDDIDGDLGDLEGIGTSAPATGYLLCLTEKAGGGTGADEKVHVGIVAVQPSTGDVIYDEFEDGFMRSEIETRLLHIAPCELLIVGDLTKATDKLVTHLAGSTTSVFGDKIRMERVEKTKDMVATAASHISKFYADKVNEESTESSSLLDTVLNFPDLVTLCLSAMITHLSSYGLEHVFDLTKYFQSFNTRSHMMLNGNTLSSLEIYRNQTDYTEKGSLFWTLDRTKTKFGKRLLRKWVGRPLVDKIRLEERMAAVEEIRDEENPKLIRLKELLSKPLYDLEKGLIRIYYGKCNRPELLSILQAMYKIASTFPKVDVPEAVGFKSMLINKCIASLPEIKEDVTNYLGEFNHQAASKDDKYSFFSDEDKYEAIAERKMGIIAVETELKEHLNEAARECKKKKVSFVTVSGIEFLIEIENTKEALRNVPANWVKISGTKRVSRFHTPAVLKLIAERDQLKESLAAECDRAYSDFLSEVAVKYQCLRDVVQNLATLDCLLSLATVANQPDYVKPEYTMEPLIDVKQGRHPMVEQLLLGAYVPNNISLHSDGQRAMLVTGPNMGGKSSFVRQVALISIMAQIGSYVPAASAKLGLLDAVYTRMGAHDNMMAGESTFMVELSETSDILKQASPRSLVILDELGRGTSTHDGVAIAYAVLDYVINDLKSICLFVTHYPLLAQFGDKYPQHVINAHMRFEESSDPEDPNNITFLYQVGEGVAHRSYGLNVARLAGLSKSVLELSAVKSRELEMKLKAKETERWIGVLKDVVDVAAEEEVRGKEKEEINEEVERLFQNLSNLTG